MQRSLMHAPVRCNRAVPFRHASRSLAPSIVAAKKKKGPSGPGGSGGGGGSQKGGSANQTSYKAKPVRDGNAYTQETRKVILSLERVRKVTPTGKEILKNINLGMYLGAKIGILGSNGAGKSSLMRILAGVDTNFNGNMNLSSGIRVGYLAQEPELADGATVAENIAVAVAEVRSKVQEFEDISVAMGEPDADFDKLTGRMEALQAELDAVNGWEIDRVVDQAMDALRCPPGDALVDKLSGGERRRVALCRLVLARPQIMLLDEPTNHLDAESVAWLERFLADFKGTVVAITHDRYFLDNVAGWILELDRGAGIPFEGNYSEWLGAKDKRLQVEEKQQSSLKKTIEAELEWMRQGAKGQQKKGKARERRYEELVSAAGEHVRSAALDSIVIPLGPRLGDVVVRTEGLSKAFGDRLLLDKLDLDVPPGSVVGIIGGNGAGKSTLFRMIMGAEKPDGGNLVVGETVVPMYVDQSRDSLDANKSVYEEIGQGREDIDLNGRLVNTRQYCSWYNFKGGDQQKKVGMLSGGERNRLQLAKVLQQSGNLLLLDEPTNDLDVDTLRCLEEAIERFAGTALVVSHDRWFLDRVATHILAFEGDSTTTWYTGNYSEYEEARRQRLGIVNPSRVKFRKLAAV